MALTASVAAAAAFSALAVKGFESANALGTAADRAGVAVESLSKLKFAAEQSNVNFEALAISVKKWQVTLSSAASGGKQASDALALINLKAADLKGLSLEDQLGKIANQFQRIQDPADKTRVAVELFGRAGEELVPLLNQGADGIRQMTNRADELGITLSEKTVKSVDKADKALKILKATIESFGQRAAGSIAEAIVGPVDNIDSAERSLQKLIDERQALISNLGGKVPSAQFDALLKAMDARIQGARDGLEIVRRMEKDAETVKNPLAIPVDTSATDKLMASLEMVRVGESLLKDPLIEWEKQTRTSSEKAQAEFIDFETSLTEMVKGTQEKIADAVRKGKISSADAQQQNDALTQEANKRFNEHLDDSLKPVQINVDRLKVPLTAAQDAAKKFSDTLAEGLQNAARQGELSGKAILRNLLAAFESKALFNAIDELSNYIGTSLSKAAGGTGGWASIANVLLGAFGGSSTDSLQPVTPTVSRIPVHAAGGGSMSGYRVVGEDGPEVETGAGQVLNRRQLAFAMGGAGTNINMGDTNITINGSGSPEQVAGLLEVRIQQNNKRQADELSRRLKSNGFGDLR